MISRSLQWQRSFVGLGAFALTLVSAQAQMGTGWIGAGDGRNIVRDNFTFGNGTGFAANDLHAIVSVQDDSAYIEAAYANTPQGNIAGSLAAGPKPKSFTIDVTNINVAAGGTIALDWGLDLNHLNQRWVSWWWTNNGQPIGDPRLGNGHNVGGPIAGGNGGGGPGAGGGKGGQAGGGGTGNYVHPFTIFNVEHKAAVLSGLYLFATMDYYADLGSIPWNLVDPIDLGPTNALTIAADSSFTFDLATVGSYTGGHIYYRYTLTDDFTSVIGDHPVEEPVGVPEPAAFALLGAAACLCLGSRRLLSRRNG